MRRAFDTYCERALQSGSLSQSQRDQLAEHVARVDLLDDAEMRRILEEELCGAEVEVVGVTGRHPLGWWGDGTVGRVQVCKLLPAPTSVSSPCHAAAPSSICASDVSIVHPSAVAALV